MDTVRTAAPARQVRALHDAETITVYQAYGPVIAEPAARDGRFSTGFSRTRMTWIKPSFCWSDLHLQPLPYRAVQIGLSGPAFAVYADEWIVGIDDLTERCHRIHALVTARDLDGATAVLPMETLYGNESG